MAEYLSNRDGGKTDEHGLLRAISTIVSGDVTNGLAVRQSGTPAMSVIVKVGDIAIDSGTGFRYCGWVDADKTLTITTANATNPRKDLVVAYIDKSVVQSTTSNNINALKLAVVAGTAAASPVEPSGATIQTAVGAGNPYCILALVAVPATDTIITDNQITDRRTRVPTLANIRDFISSTDNFVIGSTGLLCTAGTGLSFNLSAGQVFIAGCLVDVSAMSNVALTASVDNYIDIDKLGNIYVTTSTSRTYTFGLAPTLASDRKRLAIIRTNATVPTNIWTTGYDDLGNSIHNANNCMTTRTSISLNATTLRLTMTDNETNTILYCFTVPTDYVDGSDLILYVGWRPGATGLAKLTLTSYRMRPEAAYVQIVAGVNIDQTFTVSTTSTSGSIYVIPGTQVRRGDTVRVDITRDGGNVADTINSVLEFENIRLSYRARGVLK